MTAPGTGRPHRILLTLPDLALGGGQIIVRSYLQARDQSRFDVRVATLHPEPADLLDDFRALGATPVDLHHDQRRRPLTVARLAALLRRDGIDLVHVHGPEDRRVGLAAAAVAAVPALCHLHSEWRHLGTHHLTGASRSRRARNRVTATVRDATEHRAVREYLADSTPVADAFRPFVSQPVRGMDHTIDAGAFDVAAAAHDDRAWRAQLGLGPGPVVVNVSRLAEGKGHHRLVEAFAQVNGHVPAAQLVLVGDGPLRGALEARVRELDLGHRVRFLGQRRDVAAVLAGADVFAFASATETFALVVGEAMAARLPVVALRLPAIDDYTTDGVTGFFPAQHDDAGFVASLCKLLADPALCSRMGAAGRSVVDGRFGPRATADAFEDAYRRVLEGAKPARRRRSQLIGVPLSLARALPIGKREPGTAAPPPAAAITKG